LNYLLVGIYKSFLLDSYPPSPSVQFWSISFTMSESGTSTPQDQTRKHASAVTEHLPAGYTADFDGAFNVTGAGSTSVLDRTQPEEESSLKLQGGDIHRDLYKIDARAKLQKRAATFSHPRTTRTRDDDEVSITASEQLAPGGFRREFIASQRGRYYGRTMPITRNFVEFLDLYGGFAGEDLADSEDESVFEEEEEEEEAQIDERNERRPLLGKRKSSRGTRKGDAGMMKSFFTLLKAFIGTGIMFLPKAFFNGGILFSSITLILVSALSMVAFHLLLQCRNQYGGGYGDIGRSIGGTKMRALILGSITFSQLGFVQQHIS
jgi:proton-coupled amino acid transporter